MIRITFLSCLFFLSAYAHAFDLLQFNRILGNENVAVSTYRHLDTSGYYHTMVSINGRVTYRVNTNDYREANENHQRVLWSTHQQYHQNQSVNYQMSYPTQTYPHVIEYRFEPNGEIYTLQDGSYLIQIPQHLPSIPE